MQVYSCRCSVTTECPWQAGFPPAGIQLSVFRYYWVPVANRFCLGLLYLGWCFDNTASPLQGSKERWKKMILGYFGVKKGVIGGSKSEKVWEYVISSETGIQRYITRLYWKMLILGYLESKVGHRGTREVKKWKGLKICIKLWNRYPTVYYMTIFKKCWF